jgi:hypothetical protein
MKVILVARVSELRSGLRPGGLSEAEPSYDPQIVIVTKAYLCFFHILGLFLVDSASVV